jgi:uncharacterized membrane protein YkvA (DUF1232 family)/lambda repressor-like predicted transcriptional regulator
MNIFQHLGIPYSRNKNYRKANIIELLLIKKNTPNSLDQICKGGLCMQAKVQDENLFGTYLRSKLEGISIRKLARECGVDPATISRLINGKQKPQPIHLEKIAHVLHLPVIKLWQAAGYIKDEQLQEKQTDEFKIPHHPSCTNKSATSLQPEVNFDSCTLPTMEGLDPARVKAELEKYYLYAQTDEGREIISLNFNKKIDQIKCVGPFITKLQALYQIYLEEKTDQKQKHIIGGLLLYFILPTDIIPDYLFPIGYLDDAMATEIIWQQIQGLPC